MLYKHQKFTSNRKKVKQTTTKYEQQTTQFNPVDLNHHFPVQIVNYENKTY